MYNKELEDLIQEFLTDGIISDKERQVLLNKAKELGLNVDEVDLYIDAQQQKVDQAVTTVMNQRKGNTCPYCGAPIPLLADKCPSCGQFITPESSKDLEEILNNLEDALVKFKSGKNTAESQANVERYIRKARMYYSNNPKIKPLLQEVENEIEEANKREDETKRKAWNVVKIEIGVGGIILAFFFIMMMGERGDDKEGWIVAIIYVLLGLVGLVTVTIKKFVFKQKI